ncbi:MAG: efflux RND transporter permease subunit [Parvularculaceae bacterium]
MRTADGRKSRSVVADAEFAPSYKRIERRDRARSARVTGELRVKCVDRAAIMKAFNADFVPHYASDEPALIWPNGDAEAQAEFMQEFVALYAVALFAMYMLLAIAFGSYWQPVLIMCAIPFGFMGAAFGHFIFGLDFALFLLRRWGCRRVVVNDNLVLIDLVNRLRAQGVKATIAALVRAGTARFRPDSDSCHDLHWAFADHVRTPDRRAIPDADHRGAGLWACFSPCS